MTNQGESENQINFDAPAVLRKWPSVDGKHVSNARWPDPYLVADATLGECILEFMAKPISQRHLYEIHTAPQTDLVVAVMSADHIVEIARLRDFL
jgi:hypothetical protein